MAKPTITGQELRQTPPHTNGAASQRGQKRGPGRPPLAVPRSRVMQIRMTEVEFETIRQTSFQHRQTMSEFAMDLMRRGGLTRLQKDLAGNQP